MKRKLGLAVAIVMGCVLLQTTALASENQQELYMGADMSVREKSVLLPEEVGVSVDYDNETRGTYIALSSLSLSNKGYGVLGAYVSTSAHVNIKKIRMNVYLDQWNEATQEWEQISFKQLVYEDKTGEDELHEATESFDIEGCEPGYYYRLRATHAVWSFSGATEVHATRTDGVLLTSGPI